MVAYPSSCAHFEVAHFADENPGGKDPADAGGDDLLAALQVRLLGEEVHRDGRLYVAGSALSLHDPLLARALDVAATLQVSSEIEHDDAGVLGDMMVVVLPTSPSSVSTG